MNVFGDLVNFLKNPIYEEDPNIDSRYRRKTFFQLLIWALISSFILGSIIAVLITMGIDIGEHMMEKIEQSYSPALLFFMAVVLAPLIEELIFRGPMVYFKNSKYFKLVFWTFTLIFGFYHITNYERTTATLVLAPLLVLPQIVIGGILGFIRIRFGLSWAVGLHSAYNFILLAPTLMGMSLKTSTTVG